MSFFRYHIPMSRYRLLPSPAQEKVLRNHCAHARFVWNLAVEQQSWWRPGRTSAPGWVEHSHQLTEARSEYDWLAAGSVMVQQQALRDFSQAMANYFRGSNRRPTWRKAGRNEGFRVVALRLGQVQRLNRHQGQIYIPKAGWVRFRWSRPVPQARSFRVKLDRADRWHLTFAAIPQPIAGPGTGEMVGVDRGVAVSAALSTGEILHCPHMSSRRKRRFRALERRLARAKRGSKRRAKVKLALARLKSHQADARTDWAEKLSTDLARRFDVICVENLPVRNMTRSAKGTVGNPGRNVRAKAGLNREILASGWGILVRRLEQKAPGRVKKTNPAYTSQRCSACGHVASENRKSQAVFACTSCRYTANADVNAASNIAAGHAVTARGGSPLGGPVNREPQPALLST
jgi:putative transposase